MSFPADSSPHGHHISTRPEHSLPILSLLIQNHTFPLVLRICPFSSKLHDFSEAASFVWLTSIYPTCPNLKSLSLGRFFRVLLPPSIASWAYNPSESLLHINYLLPPRWLRLYLSCSILYTEWLAQCLALSQSNRNNNYMKLKVEFICILIFLKLQKSLASYKIHMYFILKM